MEFKHLAENSLFLVIFVLALLPLVIWLLRRFPKAVAVLGVVALGSALLVLASRSSVDSYLTAAVPEPVEHEGMVPSETCAACHPGQYASWHASFHRTMTQVAGPESVVAPFDGRTLIWRDKAFRVDQRDKEYWVTEVNSADFRPGEPGAASKRVVMTTGSRHQQIYWTSAPNGSLKQFDWVYEIAMDRWIPSEHTFLRPDDWQQHTPTWNQDCIRCHSVGAQPNFDENEKHWDTQVTELGIACAGCHGPAETHVKKHQNPLNRHLERILDRSDPTIVNPRRLVQERSAEVCGQCHSFAGLPGGFYDSQWSSFRAGKQLDDHYQVLNTTNASGVESMFWPDGAARTGGREYNSMVASGCYLQGDMTCISCHSLHGDEPLDLIASSMNGDKACVQCHADIEQDVEMHTFHDEDSNGSRCLNCHMPYTTYALLGAVRSHKIVSPTTTGITTNDQPNACNLCHLDKTLAWTAEHLNQRYGTPMVELEAEQEEIAASVLWTMRGDAAQRTTAAWHMGQRWALDASGDDWEAPYLSRLLLDSYSVVRLIAHQSLVEITGKNVPFDYIGTEQERNEVMDSYLQAWVLHNAIEQGPANSSTLLLGAGKLDMDTIERLYQQRDNRRLLISE